MVRGEPKTEVELKSEHHRKDHEKHVKAKNERLERHSASGKDRGPKKAVVKTEVELKSEHHRKDHEKHVKAKNERLERHSASGKDGGPKKGGCGGKGTW
eukprot:CAMPEP_0177795386 /NCGR_PEP_ID=MMETSP0491_2-20121128/26204_1 /TAXON_ID=63592 /ORGANISM="Tetraselmis chuii, Strain PLY429" /LENGTH=98 /DNA_ID=CAMNT_0019318211 /DNA_START=145 /DNA_END=439 /DNA_ORIENTATION=+